jgi:hypothetical protein
MLFKTSGVGRKNVNNKDVSNKDIGSINVGGIENYDKKAVFCLSLWSKTQL